jgi:flagellar basal body-associated protein FliL
MDEQIEQPKKSKVGIWILIILILLAVGVGVYFWLSGNAGSSSTIGTSIGSSIPQPPALPTG